MKHTLPILFTMLLCGTSAFPQEGCYSRLQNDTLTIGTPGSNAGSSGTAAT